MRNMEYLTNFLKEMKKKCLNRGTAIGAGSGAVVGLGLSIPYIINNHSDPLITAVVTVGTMTMSGVAGAYAGIVGYDIRNDIVNWRNRPREQ